MYKGDVVPLIKYLYIPDLPADEKFLDKVCNQFLKKAFISDAVLYVLVPTGYEYIKYVCKYHQKGFGACNIMPIEANKFYNGLKDYVTVMDQIDCYISGSRNPQEFTYTEMAYDRGKDIISLHQEDIFEDMPINVEKLQDRRVISSYVKKIADAYPIEEYEWFLSHDGLGETPALFYYAKAYRQKINKKLLFLCFDETRKSLFEESPYIDATILIPVAVHAYISIYLADKFHIKNLTTLAVVPSSTEHLDGQKITSAVIRVRDFLELGDDVPLERYPVNISQHKIEYVNNLFREMDLTQGKTVFLIMDGISNGDFFATRSSFFIHLANILKEKGYDVVTKGDRQLIPGCQFTILPPWESALFAGLCGNVITIHTGISFAIGALNQSADINIHMLNFTSNLPAIRKRHDMWNFLWLPIIRDYGKKHAYIALNELYEMDIMDIMFGEKSKFIPYADEEWNDQTIAKILANL